MTKDINETIVDGRFKDDRPLATVEKIRQILADLGLQTEDVWNETDVPYCYAMSVKLPGTIFRVNGKGLTREFTLASGYGEFMERLQMGFINGPNVLKDGDFAVDNGKYEMLPMRQLLSDPTPYQRMADSLARFTGIRITPEQIVGQYADANGLVSSTPFFDLTTQKKTYLPTILRRRVYASNGCAAGNSPEEAIVQAISEIVERNHQLSIIDDCLTLPDIPEETLKSCKVAYDIITFVRENGYKVHMKDASLGTGFPVVCACIIDRRTGRYHTHFGAYPIFEIALERSLTESFQGRNIKNIATFEGFSYKKTGNYSLNELSNELTMGTWAKRPEFFAGKPHRQFDPALGFPGGDNRALLRQCVDYFNARGYQILVRDRSCLGFPTYQVIVPGYSEAQINRLSINMDDHRYAPHAIKTLRSPADATIQDMLGLMLHLDQMKQFSDTIRGVHGFLMSARLTAKISKEQEQFLMSASLGYVYHVLGKRTELLHCVQEMLPFASATDEGYLVCLKQYLSLLQNGYTAEQAQDFLRALHEEDTLQRCIQALSPGNNPMSPFILHCPARCDQSCPIYDGCCQKRTDQLSALLDEKMASLSFDAFAQQLRSIL
ncbi:MAG: YcaO-like family protein [Oscillospiraceae bacterium]|nr:YcaO-like family protein [Oscillospiraceae bacterium]